MCRKNFSKLRQHCLCTANPDLTGLCLSLSVNDLSVVDNNGVSACPLSLSPTNQLGKPRASIRGEHDIVVLDSIGLLPRRHDPGIVEGDDDDDVDPLGFEGFIVVNVARQVTGRAARCEGAWDSEENNLLASEL